MDIGGFCRRLHAAMLAEQIFPVGGIRLRAYRADYAIVADGLPQNDFIAMTLSVAEGRRTEDLAAAGERLFAAGCEALSAPLSTPYFAFSLEIRTIDPVLSWKRTPIHERLSSGTGI